MASGPGSVAASNGEPDERELRDLSNQVAVGRFGVTVGPAHGLPTSAAGVTMSDSDTPAVCRGQRARSEDVTACDRRVAVYLAIAGFRIDDRAHQRCATSRAGRFGVKDQSDVLLAIWTKKGVAEFGVEVGRHRYRGRHGHEVHSPRTARWWLSHARPGSESRPQSPIWRE